MFGAYYGFTEEECYEDMLTYWGNLNDSDDWKNSNLGNSIFAHEIFSLSWAFLGRENDIRKALYSMYRERVYDGVVDKWKGILFDDITSLAKTISEISKFSFERVIPSIRSDSIKNLVYTRTTGTFPPFSFDGHNVSLSYLKKRTVKNTEFGKRRFRMKYDTNVISDKAVHDKTAVVMGLGILNASIRKTIKDMPSSCFFSSYNVYSHPSAMDSIINMLKTNIKKVAFNE